MKKIVIVLSLLLVFTGCQWSSKKFLEAQGGIGEGTIEDNVRTPWFDYKIESIEVVDNHYGYVASEGYVILAISISFESTIDVSQPIFEDDFIVSIPDRTYGSFEYYSLEYEIYFRDNPKNEGESINRLWAGSKDTYTWHYYLPIVDADYFIVYKEHLENDLVGNTYFIKFDIPK